MFNVRVRTIYLPTVRLVPCCQNVRTGQVNQVSARLVYTPNFQCREGGDAPQVVVRRDVVDRNEFSIGHVSRLPQPIFQVQTRKRFGVAFFFLRGTVRPDGVSFARHPILRLYLRILIRFFHLNCGSRTKNHRIGSIRSRQSNYFKVRPSRSPMSKVSVQFSKS